MAAVRKYGAENFKKEILCICESREEVSKQEINYIQETDAVNSPEYYNLRAEAMILLFNYLMLNGAKPTPKKPYE